MANKDGNTTTILEAIKKACSLTTECRQWCSLIAECTKGWWLRLYIWRTRGF